MVVDRRLAVAALAVAAFGAGWLAHTRSSDAPQRPPLERAAPILEPQPSALASTPMQAVFDEIYHGASWGKNADDAGSSGSGSSLRATLLYRTFLQQFMRDAEVHSVVDAGCGDWEFSKAIDWTGIDYKGFDIVKSIIEHDNQSYGKANIQFYVANVVDKDLPRADLLIVKHVLQHLPTADVQTFLKQLPKYKHVLVVNSVNAQTLSGTNPDIDVGEFRELDVTQPPFNLHATKVLTYWDGDHMQQVVYVPRES